MNIAPEDVVQRKWLGSCLAETIMPLTFLSQTTRVRRTNLIGRILWHVTAPVSVISLLTFNLCAQPLLPADVGTTVNGFQDDFDGTALNPNWVVSGVDVFSVSEGLLHITSATGDPNHLLYEFPGYDDSAQEVLARIRVLNFGSGDPVRGGVGVGVDPVSNQGINSLFRNNNSEGQTGNHLAFLDDLVAWGPGQNFVWQPNTWYWLRVRHEPNSASQGGANDVFEKIWLADGSVAEPANWQLTWDYTPAYSARTGYAGITASSSGGVFQFDVDYILIKAAGLPHILVAPGAFRPDACNDRQRAAKSDSDRTFYSHVQRRRQWQSDAHLSVV